MVIWLNENVQELSWVDGKGTPLNCGQLRMYIASMGRWQISIKLCYFRILPSVPHVSSLISKNNIYECYYIRYVDGFVVVHVAIFWYVRERVVTEDVVYH